MSQKDQIGLDDAVALIKAMAAIGVKRFSLGDLHVEFGDTRHNGEAHPNDTPPTRPANGEATPFTPEDDTCDTCGGSVDHHGNCYSGPDHKGSWQRSPF